MSRGSGGEVEAVAATPTNDAGVVHSRDGVEDGGDAPAVNRPSQDVREVREVPGNKIGQQWRRNEGYSGGDLRVDLARAPTRFLPRLAHRERAGMDEWCVECAGCV